MKPQFLRAVLLILTVRAIFLSPVEGSECGPSLRLGASSIKRLDLIRPSRLRFTKPCVPSASQERIDCLDGGDDDDDRASLAEVLADSRFWVISPHLPLPHCPSIASPRRLLVRLRG